VVEAAVEAAGLDVAEVLEAVGEFGVDRTALQGKVVSLRIRRRGGIYVRLRLTASRLTGSFPETSSRRGRACSAVLR
jgi:hypothetical protein